MKQAYLNKVLIYLQQELPQYQSDIQLADSRFIIVLRSNDHFQQHYEVLQELITASINRIRNRETDLEFTIKSLVQERDFRLSK